MLQAQTVALPLLQLPESSECCWPSQGQNPSRLRVPGPLPRARARGEVGAQRLVQVRQFRVVFARALQTLLNQEHTLTETESGGGWGELAFFFFFLVPPFKKNNFVFTSEQFCGLWSGVIDQRVLFSGRKLSDRLPACCSIEISESLQSFQAPANEKAAH